MASLATTALCAARVAFNHHTPLPKQNSGMVLGAWVEHLEVHFFQIKYKNSFIDIASFSGCSVLVILASRLTKRYRLSDNSIDLEDIERRT